MGRGGARPGNDAAFLEQHVYTPFGRLAAGPPPIFLMPKSRPPLPRPLASILAKGTSKRHHAHGARPSMGRWRNGRGSSRPGLYVR